MLSEFSWHPIDVILGVIVLEWLGLSIYHARSRRGVPPLDLAVNLLSGFLIFAALRAALTGAGPLIIATLLLLSFVAHVADLRRRWRH